MVHDLCVFRKGRYVAVIIRGDAYHACYGLVFLHKVLQLRRVRGHHDAFIVLPLHHNGLQS